jgi:hypothetical protein
MLVECIENKHGNGNFTKGEKYKVWDGMISCDFIKLNLPKDFVLSDTFNFAMCKFKIVE